MRLQVSTRIAIFATLELVAREGHPLSVAAIGEKFDISSHHLAKVMNVLTRAGFVRAVRGAGGGYQFSGNARRMTLLDVMELFEDLSSIKHDSASADGTPEGRALGRVIAEIDDIARATLGSITLATMRKLVGLEKTGNGRRSMATKRSRQLRDQA
jgi:Rrf2 family nitric oxide-sensitive transcriptional repressor